MKSAITESRVDRGGLIRSIVVTVLVAAVTNGLLAAFRLNAPLAQRWPSFAPPGPVIGVVWIVLFGGMGAALWLAPQKRAVLGMIALCLAYPFYTHFVGSHLTELIGNLITFGYSVWLSLHIARSSRLAAIFIGAVAAWVAFATALVLALVQLNGWATSVS